MTARRLRLGLVHVTALTVVSIALSTGAAAQDAPIAPPTFARPDMGTAPLVLTLADALERARKFDAEFHTATADAQIAVGDRVQAHAALLPSFSATTQYLGTKGDTPLATGRFVSNDGVNLYRAWLVAHQELSLNMTAPYRKAQAAESLAQARLAIATRGLAVTVTQLYYGLITAERHYASVQQAVSQAQRFLTITQQEQAAGQVAQSDVVKADLQFQQQQQAFQDAALQMENARLSLAVVVFPTLNENFTVVDDLSALPPLPPVTDLQGMATRDNPSLRAATGAVQVAEQDVRVAKNAFLPTLLIDADYGIEANEFALHSVAVSAPELGVLPNLGYFLTVNLSVPIFDWGGLKSKLQQSHTRQSAAEVALSQAQRQLQRDLYASYNEATAARAIVATAERASSLAAESLRLINLRYQAGESTVLEVVDAQNTLLSARAAYDAALARYRIAIATLQVVTGPF